MNGFVCTLIQLKEMVLATLRESELSLTDNEVEAIVDKVMKSTGYVV